MIAVSYGKKLGRDVSLNTNELVAPNNSQLCELRIDYLIEDG